MPAMIDEIGSALNAEVKRRVRLGNRPAITYGKEIEVLVWDRDNLGKIVWPVLHQDWALVWETSLPPFHALPTNTLDPLPLTLYQIAEYVINLVGPRSLAVYEQCHRLMTTGSHFHLWVSQPRYDLQRKLTRLANMIIFTVPAMARLLATAYRYDECYEEIRRKYGWRSRASYYATPPRYINSLLIEDPGEGRGWRGYEPGHGNAFYAVEVNKYRKRQPTLEVRLPENHWMADLALLDLLYHAIEGGARPPFVNLRCWYEELYNCRGKGYVDERRDWKCTYRVEDHCFIKRPERNGPFSMVDDPFETYWTTDTGRILDWLLSHAGRENLMPETLELIEMARSGWDATLYAPVFCVANKLILRLAERRPERRRLIEDRLGASLDGVLEFMARNVERRNRAKPREPYFPGARPKEWLSLG